MWLIIFAADDTDSCIGAASVGVFTEKDEKSVRIRGDFCLRSTINTQKGDYQSETATQTTGSLLMAVASARLLPQEAFSEYVKRLH